MRAVITFGERLVGADLSDALSIAIPLDFDGPQPNAFGAGAATAQALRDGDFVGDTRVGGSVNCEVLTLAPHCNGTHTECVGHLTDERIAVTDALHGGLWLAAMVTVAPTPANGSGESTTPPPRPMDLLVTREALEAALERTLAHVGHPDLAPEALIVRTLPNGLGKLTHRYPPEPSAPYFTAEAADWLVDRGILHLVTDLPSLDRSCDDGALCAHRIYWRMPATGRDAGAAARRDATVTELAFIAPMVRDGLYLLDLQVPPFLCDAAPARPLLYPATIL